MAIDGVRGSFLEWMYPKGGGDENVESAALGVLILWTTWYAHVLHCLGLLFTTDYRFAFNAGSTESIEGKRCSLWHYICDVFCVAGKISHASVGRIALVMALAAASGGLTSTIVSGLIQVITE